MDLLSKGDVESVYSSETSLYTKNKKEYDKVSITDSLYRSSHSFDDLKQACLEQLEGTPFEMF